MRNHWWDWLKILAAWAMLCDHLRFVWPEAVPLFWFGRIAFPIFGVIAAANFSESLQPEKYLRKLLVFGLASEIPFQLLSGSVGNVLLLFAFTFSAVHFRWWLPALGAFFCVYSLAGAIPLAIWCQRRTGLYLAFGGAMMNSFPFSLVSGVAALLPTVTPGRMQPAPFLGRDWLWWFYPGHLLVLLVIRNL